MKLLTCEATHFGSYPSLKFDFQDVGLGLIQGPTGAGKSTIADVAAWGLFGVTAKDGNADEVRSWQADGEPTEVVLVVELPDGIIHVRRVRGTPKQNDLAWWDGEERDYKRGKDLAETQKLLEKRLGVTADLYLTGAYFHEFSSTGSFFTAKAKDRRAVFERIADLSLPVRVGEAAADARKTARANLQKAETAIAKSGGSFDHLQANITKCRADRNNWYAAQSLALRSLAAKEKSFDQDLANKVVDLEAKAFQHEEANAAAIAELVAAQDRLQGRIPRPKSFYDEKRKDIKSAMQEAEGLECPGCGGPKAPHIMNGLRNSLKALDDAENQDLLNYEKIATYYERIEAAEAVVNPYLAQLEAAMEAKNTYSEQYDAKAAEVNPYEGQLADLYNEEELAMDAIGKLGEELQTLEHEVASLTQAYDLSFVLRGELLKKSVKEIETETNRYLETYFDSAIRVTFEPTGADSLDVSIQKDGFDCVYRQLSKGQRGLLKLCFVVSVMQAASNKAGVHFANLWFDESLDGFDVDLKLKAFRLFEELSKEHESVVVIDHCPEFQNSFDKRYQVELEGGHSVLSEIS